MKIRNLATHSFRRNAALSLAACAILLLTGCTSSKPPQPPDRSTSSTSPSPTQSAPGDLAQAIEKLGLKTPSGDGGGMDSGGAGAPLPHFPPISAGETSAANRIALQPGMTIVESVYDPLIGDFEVVISVDAVTDDAVTLTISAQLPDTNSGPDSSHPSTQKTTSTRLVSQQDSLHASATMTFFSDMFPESIPGTTAIALSQDTMRKIKAGESANLTGPKGGWAARAGMMSALFSSKISQIAIGSSGGQEFWSKIPKFTCSIARLEGQDAAFPVLLNGHRVTLPSVHASCKGDRSPSDDYVLDNDALPLILAGNSAETEVVGQVTQINYPSPEAPRQGVASSVKNPSSGSPAKNSAPSAQGIEQALQQNCRVDVYGIYFDFDSYQLRPESEPALREIADALTNKSSLKLQVAGHTDNIGGEVFNQKLSEQRAASVKDALVTRYQIAPTRLTTRGYGLTRPIDTNATIEGRARNRRVELTCQ